MPTVESSDPNEPARRTVLVVDDDEDLRQELAGILEDEGFRALSAENGKRALLVLEREVPSLMLIDVFMPVMDGLELVKCLRSEKRYSQIQMIVMTAADDRMLPVKLDLAVLYKPIDIGALRRLLAKHFARRPSAPATS